MRPSRFCCLSARCRCRTAHRETCTALYLTWSYLWLLLYSVDCCSAVPGNPWTRLTWRTTRIYRRTWGDPSSETQWTNNVISQAQQSLILKCAQICCYRIKNVAVKIHSSSRENKKNVSTLLNRFLPHVLLVFLYAHG